MIKYTLVSERHINHNQLRKDLREKTKTEQTIENIYTQYIDFVSNLFEHTEDYRNYSPELLEMNGLPLHGVYKALWENKDLS